MFSVTTTHVDSDKILGFSAFASERLRDAVDDGRHEGVEWMRMEVPIGRTGRLFDAVGSTMISVTDDHFMAEIGVNPAIAPHGDLVDKGTGIDGPYRTPVTVTNRKSRNGHQGVMAFQKNGEDGGKLGKRYRPTVKFKPSSKIEHSKGYTARTADHMVEWTRMRTSVLSRELTTYFSDTPHT